MYTANSMQLSNIFIKCITVNTVDSKGIFDSKTFGTTFSNDSDDNFSIRLLSKKHSGANWLVNFSQNGPVVSFTFS